MEVINILHAAAKMLGLDKEIGQYFDDEDSSGEREALTLLECYNTVENELALDYFPLNAEDTLYSLTGRVDFDKLAYAPVRILSVKDKNGADLEYKLFPAYLQAKPGSVTVAYTYTPTSKDAFSFCECSTPVSQNMLLYGTLAQYALTQGMYEEAVVWDKKYKKTIQNACAVQSCKRIASRRWV